MMSTAINGRIIKILDIYKREMTMKRLNLSLILLSLFVAAPLVYAQEKIDNEVIVNDEGYGADDAEYYKSEQGENDVTPEEIMENIPMDNMDASFDVESMNAELPDENVDQ